MEPYRYHGPSVQLHGNAFARPEATEVIYLSHFNVNKQDALMRLTQKRTRKVPHSVSANPVILVIVTMYFTCLNSCFL